MELKTQIQQCLQATQFRIWATKTLKEFIIKGFVFCADSTRVGGKEDI